MVWGRLCMLIILQKWREPISAIAMSWMLTCRDATIIRTIVPVICLGFWRYIEARIVELNPLSVGFSHAHLLVSALSIYDISKGRSEDSIANLLAHCVGQQRGIPLILHIATICAAPVKVHVHTVTIGPWHAPIYRRKRGRSARRTRCASTIYPKDRKRREEWKKNENKTAVAESIRLWQFEALFEQVCRFSSYRFLLFLAPG